MKKIIFSLALCMKMSFVFAAASTNIETYTYTLTESDATHQVWTAPPSVRVFKDDAVPTNTDSGVKVYAAKNEQEPFQIVIQPSSTENITVSLDAFGTGISAELYQVKYVPVTQVSDSLGRRGDYPDPLWPLDDGATISASAGENLALWWNVSVAPTVASGEYTANAHIGSITVPVTLHVFNFAIPDEVHTKSQMNFSHNAVLSKYSVPGTSSEYWMYVDMMKQFFIDHRLTSKSVCWPGGITGSGAAPFIDYDCVTRSFSDPHGIWGFDIPADKYLNGNGFNDGTGFPSFMAATFRNNDSSVDQRPDTFCGETRSAADWYTANDTNTAYNVKWFNYMTDLQNYLASSGYLDKAYYYFANEPQDQADYDAVAWYSRAVDYAAPNLKLMVSEGPKPEIYSNATYGPAAIDIWLPVLNQYDPEESHERERTHGEETWIYFLHGTRSPYFNPITLDHPGIESKFTGWFLWKYRIKGIAYYSMNNWSKNPWADPLNDGHNGDLFMFYPPSEDNTDITYGANNHRLVPSIRLELMRDGFEDFEYLYVLNGNKIPEVDVADAADPHVGKVISSTTSYTRDDEFLYNLRRLIGLYNGGEIAEIPDIQPKARHWRSQGPPGNYYINFQDPQGEPLTDPLIVGGNQFEKIGHTDYDATAGAGWYSSPSANWMYRYLTSGPNELQKSILFSDWGRPATFEFDIPNGTYYVAVSVGWEGKTYLHHKIDIEGVSFIDDEATTPDNPYLVRTNIVTISDYKITMNMGIFDEYTMLNYLTIEAVPEPGVMCSIILALGFLAVARHKRNN